MHRWIGYALIGWLTLASPGWAANFLPSRELQSYVWEYPLSGFTEADYQAGVETLFRVFERNSGKELKPGERGRVGLKIYTSSGPGLATPQALTLSVIRALESRGFSRSQMFIVDQSETRLRASGYLPRHFSGEASFAGVPVYPLDSGRYFDEQWFYDSNLPSRERLARAIANYDLRFDADPAERKSFLAAPLLLEADFWINLPMVMDHEALGVSGALANATLWNVSNHQRFLGSPANAPVAAAEIAGIPELRETWAFTLMTLERFQYMGGPRFNSMYSSQEPRLWLSANPVALDFMMWNRIKRLKASHRFPVPDEDPPLFEYARTIGLGAYDPAQLKLRRLAPVGSDADGG